MLWKNFDFDRAPTCNWINLYSPPKWDEIVKAYDFAVSIFDKMLRGITQRDNLKALSCKNFEERCSEIKLAPVKILELKYLYDLIWKTELRIPFIKQIFL